MTHGALLAVLLLVLTGCKPALVNLTTPAAAPDRAITAWQQQVTNRVEDLTRCADVQTRQCVADREQQRKEISR